MIHSRSRSRRRQETGLLSGFATLTLDQSIRLPRMEGDRDALAGDWAAVGDDLRRAISRTRSEAEAA